MGETKRAAGLAQAHHFARMRASTVTVRQTRLRLVGRRSRFTSYAQTSRYAASWSHPTACRSEKSRNGREDSVARRVS